jgi:hypothetical protein
MRNYTCTLCGGPVTDQTVSFVDDGKQWTITLHICKRPSCLVRRGGKSVDHRALTS